MIQKSKGKLNSNRKFFFYSGHDTTLMSVMRALNITPKTTSKPDFAASLTIELHANRHTNDNFEVRVSFLYNTFET